MWSSVEKRRKTWKKVGKCAQMWENLVKVEKVGNVICQGRGRGTARDGGGRGTYVGEAPRAHTRARSEDP